MVEMKRDRYAVGNWKMYKTIEETVNFIKGLIPLVKEASCHVYLAVPFTSINAAAEAVKGSNIVIGAQNMNDATEGAFTGEIAAKMLLDAGAKFVILGHSERRHLFNETNDFINRKVKRALTDGIQPIVCVGETLEEKNAGQAQDVITKQITESLKDVTDEQLGTIVLAYEPVWAIGTGQTATPEIAEEMHQYCRKVIEQHWNPEISGKLSLLYGGSVRPDNAKELGSQPDIDGVLVGGASLSLDSFSKIVNDITQ